MWIKRHCQTGRRQWEAEQAAQSELWLGSHQWWQRGRLGAHKGDWRWQGHSLDILGGQLCCHSPCTSGSVEGKSCYKELTPDGEEKQHPSIHLRDWNLAPRHIQISGEETTCCELCSITANVKLLLLWHQACWKGFVYNCVELSQADQFIPI